jgi:hypothetical protein
MCSFIKSIAEASGVVVIDTLSFRQGRTIQECIAVLREKHSDSLLIFVTKMQYQSADYMAISSENPNIVIIECNDKVYNAQRGVPAKYRTDWLAEADDHMVQMIEVVVSLTGCAPAHEGVDQYRNSEDVANNIPPYTYSIFINGNKTMGKMNTTNKWIAAATLSIIIHGPRQQCTPGNIGFCKSNGHTKNPVCTRCSVCTTCQFGVIQKRRQFVLKHMRMRTPHRPS